MSNEYKDWLRDSAEEEKIYPYLKISSDGNSWMDYIPTGWQNRIYKLFDNINTILGDRINYFHILDIKEKYGEFRLYWTIDDGMATNAEKEQIEELAQQARFDYGAGQGRQSGQFARGREGCAGRSRTGAGDLPQQAAHSLYLLPLLHGRLPAASADPDAAGGHGKGI